MTKLLPSRKAQLEAADNSMTEITGSASAAARLWVAGGTALTEMSQTGARSVASAQV